MGYGTFSLFVLLLLAAQISPVSSPSQNRADSDGTTTANISRPAGEEPPSQAKICSNISVICNSIDDISIPWMASILSIATLIVPVNRAFHLRPVDRGGKHAMFLCSISFTGGDYMLWAAYTWDCQVRDSAYAIRVSSILGMLVCFVSVTAVVVKTYRDKEKMHQALWFWLCIVVALMIIPKDAVGWIALAIGCIAHCCRIAAMDYERFNFTLFATSAIGCLSGFLWLSHPNLCLAMHYKIYSTVAGILRGVEVFLLCSPLIIMAISKLE